MSQRPINTSRPQPIRTASGLTTAALAPRAINFGEAKSSTPRRVWNELIKEIGIVARLDQYRWWVRMIRPLNGKRDP